MTKIDMEICSKVTHLKWPAGRPISFLFCILLYNFGISTFSGSFGMVSISSDTFSTVNWVQVVSMSSIMNSKTDLTKFLKMYIIRMNPKYLFRSFPTVFSFG